MPTADARSGDHHRGGTRVAIGPLAHIMMRRQSVAPPPGTMPLADSPPPRIDPPTVLGDMPALDLASAPGGDRLTSLHPLPEGTRLLDYDIVGLIGEGGFGIVYLAYDAALERHVAIKEYLPAVLASRASSQAVMVKSERHADAFRTGLRSFVNEARLLARFDHPSLVKVLRFWEGNGTAYMVMPFYEGPTLAHVLQTLGRAPTEQELLGWLQPLLQALGTLHAARCYHRDIAPDNILLTPAGPLLLDFGAARRVVGQAVAAPTVVIKPGYAPIEQYGEAPTLKQGPWTDVYALAGVIYAAIAGQPPLPAVERWIDDRLVPLSESARGQYSRHFLAAVDAALALRPGDRPDSAAAFWAQLGGPAGTETPFAVTAPAAFIEPVDAAVPEAPEAEAGDAAEDAEAPMRPPPPLPEWAAPPFLGTVAQPWEARQRHRRYLLIALLLAALVLCAGAFNVLRSRADAPAPAAIPPVLATPPSKPATDKPIPTPTPSAEPRVAPAEPNAPRAPVRSTVPPSPPVPTPAPSPVAAARDLPPPAPMGMAEASRRCTDVLQRASIEPLRPAELAFLKRECR